MSDCATMLDGMMGWLTTVAGRFGRHPTGLDRDDFVQEAAFAILRKGATNESLAKVVAVRAMNKLRNRQGFWRVTEGGKGKRCPLPRSDYDDLSKLTTEQEPDGIFWDNLSKLLSETECRTLRLWAEDDLSAEEIGEVEGITGGGVKNRLKNAIHKIRAKWGVADDRTQ